MSAGPTTILNPDTDVQAEKKWQLLKSLSIAQTPVSASGLWRNLHDFEWAEDTIEFLDVSRYGAIRFQVLGVASATNAPALTLYGWHASGPGSRMAIVTATFGAFSSVANTGFHARKDTHKSITDAFAPATAYQGCSIYTVSVNTELETGISYEEDWDGGGFIANYYTTHNGVTTPTTVTGAVPPVSDFPSSVIVDFSRSRYEYFGIIVQALNSATTVGAIWKPLSLRRF